MTPPDTKMDESIDKILRAKLSKEEYEKVSKYIQEFIDDRYDAWCVSMGEDL
jgi:hypothetical protein